MPAPRFWSRRELIQASLGGLALASLPLPVARSAMTKAAAPEKKTLRVIAYNVYNCTGWPKDRALGKKATALGQMPARFSHELALYDPDIVQLSESPDEKVAAEIAERLGMKYVRFPSAGKWPGTLMSRYEIINRHNVPLFQERPAELFTRHWGRATIQLPTGGELVIHSAHLHPAPEPETRLEEIKLMLKVLKGDLLAKRDLLLIGDLNHSPQPPEYPLWIDDGFVDTFAKVGHGDGTTFLADDLSRRIDYILAAGPIAQRIVAARPLVEGAFRVNAADPESFALSDHAPQFAEFNLEG